MNVDPLLRLGPRVTLLPVIHGRAEHAVEVRRVMLSQQFDCLAVPLPESFKPPVEAAIDLLPGVSIVTQEETVERDFSRGEQPPSRYSYVPIDPCQAVIAALRIAAQEHLRTEFIDAETPRWESERLVWPDSYAVKQLGSARFASTVATSLPPPMTAQARHRIAVMASNLRRLEQQYHRVLCVCALQDWAWIRDAWRGGASVDSVESVESVPSVDSVDVDVAEPQTFDVAPQSLLFLLGELPFVTWRYEQARRDLEDDENMNVDGVKSLLLAARTRYYDDLGKRARRITPHLLRTYLRYVRNLALIERRFTPDLYTLVLAARQIAGDQFAIHVAETAREYPFRGPPGRPAIAMSDGRGRMPDGEVAGMVSRLPGPAVEWRSLELNRRPTRFDRVKWQMGWNPYSHCSWPPEDVAIERFRTHVKDKALSILGTDLARTEKFTSSLMDGLDIRETLRNWHTGDLYVKLLPPARGSLDCVVMLFDSPADPRDYPWRTTWMAEGHDESTLALFATDYRREMVGPGIGLATYGGAVFLFPPRPIPDVWTDPRLNFADTLEERILGAACLHSRERHIALLSQAPAGPGWRRLARRFGKKWIHVPLSHFGASQVQQLRLVHVLNGRQVRSYAAHFIRRA
jgi:hypothetical protein